MPLTAVLISVLVLARNADLARLTLAVLIRFLVTKAPMIAINKYSMSAINMEPAVSHFH